MLRLFIAASCSIGLAGCDAMCENEQIASFSSPSGAARAIVFNRNCGATTGFNTQLSILSGSEKLPNDGGNTLILDGSVPVKIHWAAEASVIVSGYGSAKVFKQESAVGGVVVSYAN